MLNKNIITNAIILIFFRITIMKNKIKYYYTNERLNDLITSFGFKLALSKYNDLFKKKCSSQKEYDNWICPDCSKNTIIEDRDYYMVTAELWQQYGNRKGKMCIDCFEKRLGRKLNKNDFVDCTVNSSNKYVQKIIKK